MLKLNGQTMNRRLQEILERTGEVRTVQEPDGSQN